MIMDSPSVVRGLLKCVSAPLEGGVIACIDAICPFCKHIAEQAVTLPETHWQALHDLEGQTVLILRGFSGDYTVKEAKA